MGRVVEVVLILLGFFLYVNSCTNGETETVSCMMAYDGGGAASVIEYPGCLKRVPSSEPYRKPHRRNRHNMNCESARLQGRRKYQEDHVFCDLDIEIPFYGKNGVKEVTVGMVAVFDGHGGAEASEMASKLLLDYFLLHTHFIIHHQAYSFAFSNKYYNGSFHLDKLLHVGSWALPLILNESMHMEILKEALMRTIHDIDTTVFKEAFENNLVSGSTATVILLVHGHILVEYVGDSKAVLCSEKFHSPEEVQGTLLREFKRRRRIGYKERRLATANGLTRLSAEELTRDHHPDQVDERLRIEACGGHVDWTGVPRVNGQLAVSRSIGDVEFKSYGVISLPEVMDWRPLTTNDSYLVVSSDGIYEKLTVQDVCDLLPHAHSNGYEKLKLFPSCEYPSAECIVKTAFEEGSMDNLSAVVVPLKSAGLSKNLQNRSSNDEAFSL